MKLARSAEQVADAKSEVRSLKERITSLDEERRKTTNNARELQNAAESELVREREALQDKNKWLNEEVTRLTMEMTQQKRGMGMVDEGLMKKVRNSDSDLDEV